MSCDKNVCVKNVNYSISISKLGYLIYLSVNNLQLLTFLFTFCVIFEKKHICYNCYSEVDPLFRLVRRA